MHGEVVTRRKPSADSSFTVRHSGDDAGRQSRRARPAGRHQSGRFARNLAFIAAETVEDVSGRPILPALRACLSSVAGFFMPRARARASLMKSVSSR